MRYIKWIAVITWLVLAVIWGYNFGWMENNKQWDKFLAKKIVSDIPKGSVLITRDDGNFLIGRIADQKTMDGLLERFKNNQEIEVLK